MLGLDCLAEGEKQCLGSKPVRTGPRQGGKVEVSGVCKDGVVCPRGHCSALPPESLR